MTSSAHLDELQVALPSLVSHAGQVGVSFFTVASHHGAVVERILLQEALRCVVAVDVDLGQGIVGSRLLTPFVDTRLQPWQQKFQPDETSGEKNLNTEFGPRVYKKEKL